MEFEIPINLDLRKMPPEKSLFPVEARMRASDLATFELRFSEGLYSTRSAPTGSFICALPCFKCVGGRPLNTTHRLLDRDTGDVLWEHFWGGGFPYDKWMYRFNSYSPHDNLGYMPDHDYHLRFEIEYEDGSKIYKDITITNGPYSGKNPKTEAFLECPSSADSGESVMVWNKLRNIGEEAGMIKAHYTGWAWPNQCHTTIIDVMPTDPEFNTYGFGFGQDMPPYHCYLKAYARDHTQGVGWSDPFKTGEATITCNNPKDCDFPDEDSCYENGCFWTNGCGLPGRDCQPFLCYMSCISSLLPFDGRFDFNGDGKLDFYDILELVKFANSSPPETYKVYYNCNPDIDAYLTEIWEWLGRLKKPEGGSFYSDIAVRSTNGFTKDFLAAFGRSGDGIGNFVIEWNHIKKNVSVPGGESTVAVGCSAEKKGLWDVLAAVGRLTDTEFKIDSYIIKKGILEVS